MNGKQKKLAVLVPAGTIFAIIAALVSFGHFEGRSSAAADAAARANMVQHDRLDALEDILVKQLPKIRERLIAIETSVNWLVTLRQEGGKGSSQ